MPISKIDTKINIDVNAELVNAIGNNLGRFGVYCVENIKNVISFFVKKVPNATEEKFTTMCQTSPTALRMIDDSKFAGTEEMQEIRARILAQEYNHPNSISMKSWEEMKKMSAAEFKYFEENISPYCHHLACFIIPREKIENLILVQNMNIFLINRSFSFDNDISTLLENEQWKFIEYAYFYNKNKLHFSKNALEKLKHKIMNLTEFGSDLCKICEPRPWDLSIINETKIKLEKLGLIYNTDFKFLDENNQNILQ
jgi:hypothetical protein